MSGSEALADLEGVPPWRVVLEMEGRVVEILLPGSDLADRVESLFGGYLAGRPTQQGAAPDGDRDADRDTDADGNADADADAPPDSGDRSVVAIASTGDGSSNGGYSVRLPGESSEILVADGESLLTLLEGVVTHLLLSLDTSCIHIHGAACRTEYGAVLVLGPSGSGKSSLALAWTLAGIPLYGDDVIRVDSAGRLRTFKRLLKVDPELLEQEGIAPVDTVEWKAGGSEAWVDPALYGGWSDEPSSPRLIVHLSRKEPDEAEIGEEAEGGTPTRLEPAEALSVLVGSLMGSGTPNGHEFDTLLSLLDGSEAYRLSYTSSKGASKALLDLSRG